MKKQICICFTMLAVGVVGCTGGSQSTPQAAFDSFQDAQTSEDWEKAFQYITDDSQTVLLMGCVFESMQKVPIALGQKKFDEFKKFLRQKGIDFEKIKLEITLNNALRSEAKKDPISLTRLLLTDVNDKAKCFSEILNWLKRNRVSNISVFSNSSEKKSKFGDIKIVGDRATAKDSTSIRTGSNSVEFVKIDNKWYIDFVESFDLRFK